MNNEQGFTLIELLVVVSIVSILSAIGIASYSEYKQRAYHAVLQSGIRAGVTDMEVLISSGDYPKDVAASRLINNGAPYNHPNADLLLPTARPSNNHYIWARTYTCAGNDQDRYIVQSFHIKATNYLRYDLNCNGTVAEYNFPKTVNVWY